MVRPGSVTTGGSGCFLNSIVNLGDDAHQVEVKGLISFNVARKRADTMTGPPRSFETRVVNLKTSRFAL